MYMNALKTVNKIVQVYYSSDEIAWFKELDNFIHELFKNLLATQASKTLKIHILLKHTKQCLQLLDVADGYY